MTRSRARWLIGGIVTVLLLLPAAPGRADEEQVSCASPVLPCTACHNPDVTKPFARCLAEQWSAPPETKDLKSPRPLTPKLVDSGGRLYRIYCDGCHGPDGDGKGQIAVKFDVPAIDIRAPSVQAQTDGELFWKIANGWGAMPAWKTFLSDEEIWKLAAFVRTLRKP